jgi:hypothetical protein
MVTQVNHSGISIIFGLNERELQQGRQEPVCWTENLAINAHMLIAGKSGSGKTFNLRRIVGQISAKKPKGVRVHAFDVAGDLRFQNESVVKFSESTHYGINPLSISPDPHFGGVRKRVMGFIDMVSDSSRELGPRQTAALRSILYDLYDLHGFKVKDPNTWLVDPSEATPANMLANRVYLDIPFDEKDEAKECARREGLSLVFDKELKCWHCNSHTGSLARWAPKMFGRRAPTLQDAARFAANRMRAMAAGGGSRTMRLLEEHNRRVALWVNKAKKLGAEGSEGIDELRGQVQESAIELVDSFADYVRNIETGRELETLIRYDSVETVRSLVDRLETMVSTGIFKDVEPPFDPAMAVWRYDIAPLSVTEQRLFVWTRLTQIFESALERGPVAGASEMREVIVLDEAHLFFNEREGNILDRISKEARKFGVALICASQSPSHFSEDFFSNVGTKILLGIDSSHYDQTMRKMKIERKILDAVVMGKIAAVQVASRDVNHPQFIPTRVR